MTPKQIAKFRRSEEYYLATHLSSPFEAEADTEKRIIMHTDYHAARAKWNALYAEATGDGWRDNQERFHAACSALDNAQDSVNEGCFEAESLAFYQSCLTCFQMTLDAQ